MKAVKVSKASNGWKIVPANNHVYQTQTEAINKARSIAKRNKSLLIVHKANGEISTKNTINYAKQTQPHFYGKRKLSNKDILASVISVKEANKTSHRTLKSK